VEQAFYKSVLKSSSYLFGGGVLSAAFALITMVIMARSLGLADFGYFTLSQTYVLVFVALVNFQIWQPVVKFSTPYLASGSVESIEKVVSKGFLADLWVALPCGLGGIVICQWLRGQGFFSDAALEVTSYFMTLCLINLSGAFNGLIRVLGEFKLLARDQLIFTVVRLVGVLLASYLDQELISYVVIWIAAEVIFHLLVVWTALKAFRIKFGRAFQLRLCEKGELTGFWSFTLSNNMDISFRMVSKFIDVIILGALAGKEQVAIYKVAVQVASLLLRFTDPVYQVLLPLFSRVYVDEGGAALRRIVLRISVVGLPVFVLFLAVFSLFSGELIVLLFGDAYQDAYPIAIIYFIALGGAVIGLPYVPYFQARGRADICMRVQFGATLVYLLAIYPLIDMWGGVGAAISYVVYYVAWLMIMLTVFLKCKNN